MLLLNQFSPSSCNFLFFTSQHFFLKHPYLCSFLRARDQVSYPYKTRDKITILYILIFRVAYYVTKSILVTNHFYSVIRSFVTKTQSTPPNKPTGHAEGSSQQHDLYSTNYREIQSRDSEYGSDGYDELCSAVNILSFGMKEVNSRI
jgi:hypothetical protein